MRFFHFACAVVLVGSIVIQAQSQTNIDSSDSFPQSYFNQNAHWGNAFAVTNTSTANFFGLAYSAQNTSTQCLAGIGAWFNAQQILQANPSIMDGSSVTVSNLCGPFSIINNANNSASVEFSSTGANGLPGLSFPLGGNAELEIKNAFTGVTSFTIAVTFLDFNGPNKEINFLLQAGGVDENYPYSFRISPWIDGPIGNQVTGGSVGYFGYVSDGLTTSRGVISRPRQPHTFIFNFDGTNDWSYLDGQLTCDTRLQPSSSSAGLLANAINLYIGGQITGGANFNGIISDFRFYTNVLSSTDCNGLINYLETQDHPPNNSMTVDGDSIAVGLRTTAVGASISQFIGATFPTYQVNTIGYSGRTTPEDFTNIEEWLSFKPAGQQIFFDYIGVNCFNGLSATQQVSEVRVALSWLTNDVQLLTSHGVTPIIPTLMSCQAETNSFSLGYDWRSNYNNVVLSFTNLGAIVANFASIPSLGTNGAYLDANFVDELHPSAMGYTNMWQVLLPLIQQQVAAIP